VAVVFYAFYAVVVVLSFGIVGGGFVEPDQLGA
jgi:hypothetical protein